MSNMIGLKKQAHNMMRLGLKASDIAMAAAPVALLGGPEMVLWISIKSGLNMLF